MLRHSSFLTLKLEDFYQGEKKNVSEVARNELHKGLMEPLKAERTRKTKQVTGKKFGAVAANIYMVRLKGIIMKNYQKFLEVRGI